MSVEEDIELKDLVTQTLESNGTLAKLKAQLRASIFLTLDEDNKISTEEPLINKKVVNYLETEEGRVMFSAVHEFLEFFDLNFTLSVYKSESYCGSRYQQEERQKLVEKLGLENIENSSETAPLLYHLVKFVQAKPKSLEINLRSEPDEEESVSVVTESDSIVKTEADVISSGCEDDEKSLEIKNLTNERNFNRTFDLTSPTVNLSRTSITEKQDLQKSPIQHHSKNQEIFDKTHKNDNTHGDESSSTDGGHTSVSVGNSNKTPEAITNGLTDSDSKNSLSDKPKMSPKPDKVKVKNSLSNLADLPPLQIGKTRVNTILPSLYSKESKDKSNLREHDKLFDISVEYEEDFMCSGDDLSLKSDCSKINLLDELRAVSKSMNINKNVGLIKNDSKQKSPNRLISDCNKIKETANTLGANGVGEVVESTD